MSITTFFDLVQDNDFRSFVEKRLDEGAGGKPYAFAEEFVPLYKYRPLSKYAVDDLVGGRVTATSIGEFNDLFDGSMHYFGTSEERESAAEKEWKELELLGLVSGSSSGLLNHDDYIERYTEHFKAESRLKFRLLDYLGTYVCCFSSKHDSTLMWSHYANSNSGICVEYNFNGVEANSLQKKSIFPVMYSAQPVDLHDLLTDEKHEVYQYPLDAAVLCAALNKSNVWEYEHEWRLVYVLAVTNDTERRIPIIVNTVPVSISLGFHFLKPCFYFDHKNQKEIDAAKIHIQQIIRLLDYIEQQKIQL